MPSDTVLYEVRDDGVAILTLNRPDKLNAMTLEMLSRWFDLYEEAAADENVRVIVVTGAGRGFCAGVDMEALDVLTKGDPTFEQAFGDRQALPLRIGKPVIAAINGACAGLGLIQTLMCDVRFAAEGAKMTTAFAQRALTAEHGISWLLPRIAGIANAMDLMLSARVFLAQEAQSMGVVNRVFPREQLLDETLAYAGEIAAKCSPAAMATIKRELLDHLSVSFQDAIADANPVMMGAFSHPDFTEGIQSFVEGRPPSFPGYSQA